MDGPDGGDVEQTNSKLSEGLKSCRAVVDNYRALLSSEQPTDAAAGAGELEALAPQDGQEPSA